MADMLEQIRTRGAATPQNRQADPRQELNHAGGYVFTAGSETRLRRFLTMGTYGTYYVSEQDTTAEVAPFLLDWARGNATRLVELAAEISVAGRAPRQGPALLALAAAISLGDVAGRRAAAAALPAIVRTGSHLETWVKYMEQFGGWGPVTRRAVSSWYLGKDPGALAYQLVKYRTRDDWSHANILKLAHPKPRLADGTLMADHDRLFAWVTGREHDAALLPPMIQAYEMARDIERADDRPPAWSRTGAHADKTAAYTQLIRDHPGLPWEALPDEAANQADVWRALIDNGMPVTALIRNLAKLTRLGVLAPMSSHLAAVCARLRDQDLLRKGRVHPIALLVAAKTYASGRSEKGTSTWVPVPQVTDALTDAFYLAFGAVEPSGKRIDLAVDISGSMRYSAAGYCITACELAAAMALVTAATEPQHIITAFTHGPYESKWSRVNGMGSGITPMPVSPRQRIDDVMRTAGAMQMGGTNCAVPMLEAAKHRMPVDVFAIYCADAETEILAAGGWRQYDQVHAGDEVYTLDHATGLGEWQQATAVNVFPAAPRRMLRMEGRGHSSLTTMDHRWPVRHRGNSAWGRRWKTSETLNQVDYIQCAAADSGLPVEPKFTDAFAELMAWIWTEGHVNGSRGIVIVQSATEHPEYCGRIDAALRILYGPPHEGDMRALHPAKPPALNTSAWRRGPVMVNGCTTWHLNQAAAAPFLDWMSVPEKVITPRFIRALTRAQLELFIQVSVDADGWRLKSGMLRLSQHSLARAEAFQIACTLAGYATTIARLPAPGREQWEVGVLRRTQFAPLQHDVNKDERPFTVEQVDYDGQVWCPTTPNGTWLARRNGTVYWTGNTDNETWYGGIHPHQALENYRQVMGIDARLQVVAFTPTKFSIAVPGDERMLDVSGFSSDVPVLLADHAAGRI